MLDDACRETANAAFKRRAGDWYWTSLAMAAVIHFLVLAFWPAMTVADMTATSDETVVFELPKDIVVPTPPERITRPAFPVVSDAVDDPSLTIPSMDFERYVADLPKPPPAERSELPDIGTIVPMTVAPRLLNPAEVERALQRSYPRILRDAGIGGTVLMHFLIADDGTVLRRQVAESSGHPALDAAAEDVADAMRFAPALNRDVFVTVWVAIPVVFRTR